MLAREGSENTIYYLAAWALAQCDRFEQAESALQAGLSLAREDADVAAALSHLTPVRAPLAVAFLLDVLIACDDLQAAQDALERYQLDGELPKPQPAALQQRSIEWGAFSSAFLPWRSSTALALAHLGRTREANDLVAAEVEQAHAFGAPRALGVALRAQGLLARGPERLSVSSSKQ